MSTIYGYEDAAPKAKRKRQSVGQPWSGQPLSGCVDRVVRHIHTLIIPQPCYDKNYVRVICRYIKV